MTSHPIPRSSFIPQMLRNYRNLLGCSPSGREVIYEVSIKFNDGANIIEEYCQWLSGNHIREVLKCDGFELLKEMTAPGLLVRYVLESEQAFDKYQNSETAKRLRQEAVDKYGPAFTASRKLYTTSAVFFR